MSLTIKQEKFCQEYLKDGNASRAYREAYNADNMKEYVINNKASLLLKKGEVRVRLDQLKGEIAQKELWTREDSINKLKEALAKCEHPNHLVNVIKELNAMHGFNAPIKTQTELSGELAIAAVVELPARQ